MKTRDEHRFKVENGRMPQRIANMIRRAVARLNGKYCVITLSERKPIRSNQQNNYYWGVVVKYIHEYMLDAGNNVTKLQVHEYLKKYVGGLVDEIVLIGDDGSTLIWEITGTTTEKETDKFEKYLTKCRSWASDWGILIPLPNEAGYE